MPPEENSALKKQILSVAARLFVAGGYNGFSMRQIAEELGVSKPALYYHFKDKDDLILAVITASLEEYNQLINNCLDCDASARQRLTRLVLSLFEITPEKRALIRVAGQEIVHLSPASRQTFNTLYNEIFISRITQIFQDGIQAGEFISTDARLATRIFLGMLSPSFHISDQSAQQMSDITLSIFFKGVLRHE